MLKASGIQTGISELEEFKFIVIIAKSPYTVELQWLERLWDHENMFETVVVQANEC